jgi:hypothetical protein
VAKTSCRSCLRWRLDLSTVGPPEDEEDVFHGGEATNVAVTPVLLGLVVLRGGTTVEPLENVALLEGVVDRRMSSKTPWPRGAGRGPRRAGSTAKASLSSSLCPCSRASRRGFFPFLPRLFFWRSSLDLLPSAGVSSTRLPFLPSKIAPPPLRLRQSWWRCRTAHSSQPAGCARARAQDPGMWCLRGKRARFRTTPRSGAPYNAWRNVV